jgi:hypothetical protein
MPISWPGKTGQVNDLRAATHKGFVIGLPN